MSRSLFLSAALLLAGAGVALADVPAGRTPVQRVAAGPVLLVDAAGFPVALVEAGQPVSVQVAPVATLDPIAAMMDAQMREMAAMQQAMTQQMARLAAAADAMPATAAMPAGGSSVVMVSSVNGCSRTVAWRQDGRAAPTLVADQVSGACGGSASHARAPVEVTGPARPMRGVPADHDAPKLTPVVDRHAAPATRRDTAL